MTGSWEQLGRFVADHAGLHFPPERRADLERGLTLAARELGFADCEACIEWLLTTPTPQSAVRTLGKYLTVGETYFFRERKAFDALRRVLTSLIDRRRTDREQRLRLWSAACSTGEEAYSLAILLGELLPDIHDWDIKILATDINQPSLLKAAAGVYGEWSFRDASVGFKERHFTTSADGRRSIAASIKPLVTFVQLNLAHQAGWPDAQDVILCRNLLIYFTPQQARKLVTRLHGALTPQGWLAVSPSEYSQELFGQFQSVDCSGCMLYRRLDGAERHQTPQAAALQWQQANEPALAPSMWSPLASTAWQLAADGPADQGGQSAVSAPAYAATAVVTAAIVAASAGSDACADAHAASGQARMLANQGDLAGALAWCERWVAADKIDPTAHFLYATILEAQGELKGAQRSLLRAVFLDPEFVLAQVALANLSRAEGRARQATKYLQNARELLAARASLELVPESDGMTVAQLLEIVTALLQSSDRALPAELLE